MEVSVVIPAKNEAAGLQKLLPNLLSVVEGAEVIVVDDGSTDDTSEVLKKFHVKVVKHPYSKGNGAAIKSGARSAEGEVIVFMDGDGQHDPRDIKRLLQIIESGADMAVGARSRSSQASFGRYLANSFYNSFSSWMTGAKVKDLTSGFRAVRKKSFLKILYLLPNGFSYPTTSTMAFFRSGLTVSYVDISVSERLGRSHINVFRDGLRFLLIIFKVGTLFSPMKLFFPISLGFFVLGLAQYAYTYIEYHRFTNMSALLLSCSIIIFLMGLVSEQVSSLHYKDAE